MGPHRQRLLVLDVHDATCDRPWAVARVPTGPHQDVLLVCGCCEAPLVYGWLPEELTAVVRCDDCGCACAASSAGATALPGHPLTRGYVKA